MKRLGELRAGALGAIAVPISQSGKLTHARKTRISCSHCGSGEIYKRQPRGMIERHIYRVFRFVPFWCAACDRRFYVYMKSANANACGHKEQSGS